MTLVCVLFAYFICHSYQHNILEMLIVLRTSCIVCSCQGLKRLLLEARLSSARVFLCAYLAVMLNMIMSTVTITIPKLTMS